MKLIFALLLVAGAARGQTHIGVFKTDGKGHLDKSRGGESVFSLVMIDDTLFVEIDSIPQWVKINGINWDVKLDDTAHYFRLSVGEAMTGYGSAIIANRDNNMSIGNGFVMNNLASNQKDTVPVIMLCTDISHWYRDGSDYHINNPLCFMSNGFEVREKRDHEAEPFVYEGPRFYWKHLEYLDANRKPLNPNIIVWLTK
jgi:hypothetical protein